MYNILLMLQIFFVKFFRIFAAMDARLFSRIVKELLSRGENVVLDGFGIFYVEQEPAYFSDKGYTLNPPYRKVCFKTDDLRDDALARLYAESNDIELPRAKRLIGEYVDNLKAEVFAEKSVILPEFGRLKVLSKDSVFFIPDPDLAIFPEYDLLEPISLKSLGNFSEASSAQDAPAQESIPQDAPAQESIPQDAPVQESIPEETPSQEPVAEESPADEPEVSPTNEPIAEESPAAEPFEEYLPEPRREKRVLPWLVFLIVIFVLAILFFGGLFVLGRYYPDLIDPYLYTTEELDLLRRL